MFKHKPHHLADIGFQRMLPSPALRPFVQWFWAIQSNRTILEKRQEFMHANGCLSILFNWGDELELTDSCYCQPVTLEKIGPYSRQIFLKGNIHTFGILFQPGKAFHLFGIPMQDMISTDCLPLPDLLQLHEQLYQTPTLASKTKQIELWLTKLLKSGETASDIVPASLKLIEISAGNKPIQDLADIVGTTERQLERLFNKEVGLSPKKYSRLIRLRQARTALKQANSTTLVDIANQTGFYDQAHFNHEFKKSVGITPKDYISRHEKRNS